MSNEKAKGILAKLAAMFSADDKAQKFQEYKLTDGAIISVDKLEVGGAVTKDSLPAAAGEYELEDKSKITVDAAGLITAITPAPAAAAPPATEDMTTPEGMKKAYDKFAVGTPEERLNNLETLCKALMEYSFGWQLREAQAKQTTDQAIKVYKELQDSTAQTVATTTETVNKQAALMKEMFALMTEVIGAPQADLPGDKKNKFSFANVEGRKGKFAKFQAAAKVLNERFQENLKAV
jgi:hypothetical protein